MNLALDAVKQNILYTNKQINTERRWVIAVAKIITSYNTKMQRVEQHIISLRKEMKKLYRKKKQIENLKLQYRLKKKLKDAKTEHSTLSNSLSKISSKRKQLDASGEHLRSTIADIKCTSSVSVFVYRFSALWWLTDSLRCVWCVVLRAAELAKLRGQTRKTKKSGTKCAKGTSPTTTPTQITGLSVSPPPRFSSVRQTLLPQSEEMRSQPKGEKSQKSQKSQKIKKG